MLKLLFIGDTFGRAGRRAVTRFLPRLKQEHDFDLVILNAENLANGKLPTEKTMIEMEQAGVDLFTGGNHSFQDEKIYETSRQNLIRPANLEDDAPGIGYKIIEKNDFRIGVINLIGRVFMSLPAKCPFRFTEKVLQEWQDEKLDVIFVDLHAETTSEKAAYFHAFRGKVTAIVGTHTHVPTSDATIWPEGTFTQSDVGMTGPVESVIGLERESGIANFLNPIGKKKFIPSLERAVFRGLSLDISAKKTDTFTTFEFYEENE